MAQGNGLVLHNGMVDKARMTCNSNGETRLARVGDSEKLRWRAEDTR